MSRFNGIVTNNFRTLSYLTASAAITFLFGCTTTQQEVELLSDRDVIPPPYSRPSQRTIQRAPTQTKVQAPQTDAEAAPEVPPEPLSGNAFEYEGTLPPPHTKSSTSTIEPLDLSSPESDASMEKRPTSSSSPAFVTPKGDKNLPKQEATSTRPPDTQKSGFDFPELPQASKQTHRVEKGESLWVIAQKYGVTVSELAGFNNIKKGDVLKAGTVLTIPPGGKKGATPSKSHRSSPKPTQRKSQTGSGDTQQNKAGAKYTVKPNESLWIISRRFKCSIDAIKQLNNLKNNTIHPGNVLVLPKSAKNTPATPSESSSASSAAAKEKETSQEEEEEKEEEEESNSTDMTTGAPDQTKTKPISTEELRKNGEPFSPSTLSTAEDDMAMPKTVNHTIAAGDTLHKIALIYGTTKEAILKLNPDLDPNDKLPINSKILIPVVGN